eukprot:COSAG04_NODE_29724_length_267_cov_0.619048_1_plen_68_part_01
MPQAALSAYGVRLRQQAKFASAGEALVLLQLKNCSPCPVHTGGGASFGPADCLRRDTDTIVARSIMAT